MRSILQRAQELQPQTVQDRHFLHQHPELGMNLPISAAYIRDRLCAMGYDPQKICPSGIVATVGQGGKTLLLRADYDALPIDEQAEVPYHSLFPGVMHACGHDTHAAMLLCAAQILKDMEPELVGTVKLMFQPNEENTDQSGSGAYHMVEAGVLENPHVDAALALHMGVPQKLGTIRGCAGPTNSSLDSFVIHIEGKGGHGAMPHLCTDPINVGVHIHLALQELISREAPPWDTVSLTVGSFHAGDAANVIPHTAELRGTMRTYNQQTRRHLRDRLSELVEGVACAYNATARVSFVQQMDPCCTNAAFLTDIKPFISEILGEANCEFQAPPIMPSEDFSEISSRVPSAYLTLGFGDESEGCFYAGHHPKVTLRDDGMPFGAAVLANCAVEWLKKSVNVTSPKENDTP